MTKDCPFCGEQVKEAAKKCKHCGETIDVALRSAEEAMRMAQASNRNGPMVFMNNNAAAAASAVAVAPAAAGKPRGSYIWLAFWIFVFAPVAIVYWLSRRWT